MRAVCFAERRDIEFQGPILRNAMAFGDVDGDGEMELVLGNERGELAVFKDSYHHSKPWFQTSGLRMISAIGVGPLLNPDQNTIVVVSGDGWCHLLLPGPAPLCPPHLPRNPDNNMHIAHVQCIPPNTHCLFLGDIDGDGQPELVLGLTDRVVRSYRWQPDDQGRLVSLNKWETANQVGGVSLGREADGQPSVLISQPGGTFLKITCTAAHYHAHENSLDEAAVSRIEYCPLSSSRMRSPNVSTEIVGSIKSDSKKGSLNTVATTDGTLMLIQDENILWSIQLHRQLFSLTKLDVTRDGIDEIVVCSWDGQTYILSQNQVSVRFHFEESVSAFCAGLYGETPLPCFAYSTFNDRVVLLPNIRIGHLNTRTLQPLLRHRLPPNLNKREARQLISKCLYGKQPV